MEISKYSETEIMVSEAQEKVLALVDLKKELNNLNRAKDLQIAQHDSWLVEVNARISELEAQIAEAEKLGVKEEIEGEIA